jgi:hypothetical protein
VLGHHLLGRVGQKFAVAWRRGDAVALRCMKTSINVGGRGETAGLALSEDIGRFNFCMKW